MSRKRPRVPKTFSAPFLTQAPECEKCAEIIDAVTRRPQDVPIENLRAARALADSPGAGKMVRVKVQLEGDDAVEIWACPRHTPGMTRVVGRTRWGKQTVSWRLGA